MSVEWRYLALYWLLGYVFATFRDHKEINYEKIILYIYYHAKECRKLLSKKDISWINY